MTLVIVFLDEIRPVFYVPVVETLSEVLLNLFAGKAAFYLELNLAFRTFCQIILLLVPIEFDTELVLLTFFQILNEERHLGWIGLMMF